MTAAAPPPTAAAVRQYPAGPELDRLVAEKVMRVGWNGGAPIPGYDGRWPWPPPYSTKIEAAWEVVERLRARGDVAIGFEEGRWWFGLPSGECLEAETAPLAVCRAALLKTLEAP